MKSFSLQESIAIHRRVEDEGDLRDPIRAANRALAHLNNVLAGQATNMLALALHRRPKLPEDLALMALAGEWETLAMDIQNAAEATRQRCKSATADQKWHTAAVFYRQTMIDAELARLERLLSEGSAQVKADRERMVKAGVPDQDVARLVPDPDREAARGQIAALKVEREQISLFIKTRDIKDLPADFDAAIKAAKIAHHHVDGPEPETPEA